MVNHYLGRIVTNVFILGIIKAMILAYTILNH